MNRSLVTEFLQESGRLLPTEQDSVPGHEPLDSSEPCNRWFVSLLSAPHESISEAMVQVLQAEDKAQAPRLRAARI